MESVAVSGGLGLGLGLLVEVGGGRWVSVRVSRGQRGSMRVGRLVGVPVVSSQQNKQ